MKFISLTNSPSKIIVDDEDYNRVILFNWHLNKGYAKHMCWVGSEKRNFSIGVHQYIIGRALNRKLEIDHINGNRLDNRKKNLRFLTRAENGLNLHSKPIGYSGIRGISYEKDRKLWKVTICRNNKNKNLGRFKDKKDAINKLKLVRKQFEVKGETNAK